VSGEGLSDREAALAASAVAALLARWPDEAGSSATRRAYRRLLATLTTERAVPVAIEATPRSTTTMDRLLSADEAAAALGITPQAVTARCRAGRLDATQVGGVWVITADSVARVGGTPTGAGRGTGEGWSSDDASSRFERLRGPHG
jgi:hypothetical protein